MAGYSSTLLELAREFSHGGAMAEPSAIGKSSRDGRAPYTTFFLRIDGNYVADASFQTFGCGVSIAACEALARLVIGRATAEGAALTPAEVIAYLDGVPEEKQFCVDLAWQALQAALRECGTISNSTS